jgi:TetR/AcrR family transcriptional regulator of autoinduction and epiphytic fitness
MARPTKTSRARRTSGGRVLARGRRDDKKAATQRRILQAALRLFQRNGFDATTTKQIARAAGIAEGTVFNYFRSKEEIALFFFEQEVDHAIKAVRADKRLARAPLEERLFALVEHQLEYLAPHERFIWAALLAALRPGSELVLSARALAMQARYLAFVEELMASAAPRKKATPPPVWAAQAFWIYYIGVLLYWLNDRSPAKQNTLAFLDRTLKLGVRLFFPGA